MSGDIVIPPEVQAALDETARYLRDKHEQYMAELAAEHQARIAEEIAATGDFTVRCEYCEARVPSRSVAVNEYGKDVCIDAAACDERSDAARFADEEEHE